MRSDHGALSRTFCRSSVWPGPRRSSVPAKLESAAARSGDQEFVHGLQSEGWRSDRRLITRLTPRMQSFGLARGQALDGREHGGIAGSSSGRFAIVEGVTHMDLVTLVTACALAVEPKLMHALIWHQSGGEPWAVSVQGESSPRVYSSMREAISEMRTRSAENGPVRVGLAGLAIASSKVAPAVFLPCRNVAIAANQIAKFADRCKTHPRLKTDPTSCAVAVYRGSWEQPDVKFADAVAASVVKGDAPNFDMPNDTSIEFLDVASETPASHPNAASPEPERAFEERERGWSSALFPVRAQQPASQSNDDPSHRAPADKEPSSRVSAVHPSTLKSPADSLFVPRSSDRRPQ
jgi:hypothetical protein